MTDTRYSAEELRANADYFAAMFRDGIFPDPSPSTAAMLRQAAADAETLAGIRAWLEKERDTAAHFKPFDWPANQHSAKMTELKLEAALRELDRLSRGDA